MSEFRKLRLLIAFKGMKVICIYGGDEKMYKLGCVNTWK